MKKSLFLLAPLFFFHCSLFAQTGSITNIQVSPRTDGSGNVDIFYNLTGSAPSYFVSMEVSFDNGSTFAAVSPTFLTGTSGITPGTNLHLIWNGKGSNNNTYSTQSKVKLIVSNSFPCGVPFTDSRDGKIYNTVQIGAQCWLRENLNIGTRINGSSGQTNNSIAEKFCYNDLESNCTIYGGLYQWDEMMQYVTTAGVQGICPTGWHIPTDGEWCTLTQFLEPTVNCGQVGFRGTNVGGKMKSPGTMEDSTGLWYSPNTGATNESGFTAVPAGYRYDNGFFYNIGGNGFWWSSSTDDVDNAWYRALSCNQSSVYRYYFSKYIGSSVRCLRD